MTEQERQVGRRNFIKAAATLPAAGALIWKAASLNPIRAGIIGPGGQGRVLMENANPSFIKFVGVATSTSRICRRGSTSRTGCTTREPRDTPITAGCSSARTSKPS